MDQKIATLEVEAGLGGLNLHNHTDKQEVSPVQAYLGDILLDFDDATVVTELTSDLQESID